MLIKVIIYFKLSFFSSRIISYNPIPAIFIISPAEQGLRETLENKKTKTFCNTWLYKDGVFSFSGDSIIYAEPCFKIHVVLKIYQLCSNQTDICIISSTIISAANWPPCWQVSAARLSTGCKSNPASCPRGQSSGSRCRSLHSLFPLYIFWELIKHSAVTPNQRAANHYGACGAAVSVTYVTQIVCKGRGTIFCTKVSETTREASKNARSDS